MTGGGGLWWYKNVSEKIMTGRGGYGTRMSVKKYDGGGGLWYRMSVKVMTGRGGFGTRMSVKSNDGEGGGLNSARPAVMLQMSLLSCVFLVLYGGSGSYGGIVQSVTPSMPVEFHVCACTAFHFQSTLSQYMFLSCTVWSIHSRCSYSGRLALGSPLEFWELNRNEHLGSIYF